jgi:hypothetical protein
MTESTIGLSISTCFRLAAVDSYQDLIDYSFDSVVPKLAECTADFDLRDSLDIAQFDAQHRGGT